MIASLDSSSRPRVVVVEDEALVALEMEDHLLAGGYDVVGSADTAPDAIDLIFEAKPDVVLLDIQLANETSGLDVARALKGTGIAVLFASGNCPGAVRDDAVGCLHKPYSGSQLLRAVSAVNDLVHGVTPTSVPAELHLYQ